MNTSKISIIAPIYKVEEYLVRCIESLIAQTYHNIEIILVDDGSPDGSGAICDEYVAKDSRIRVFHIPNGGVAKARQLGVENSTGEYIVFVDPDDWLPDDSLENLYSEFVSDVDIVIGQYDKVVGLKETPLRDLGPVILNNEEYQRLVIAWNFRIAPWARLYRRSLFDSDSFPKFKNSQDWLMNVHVAFKVREVKIIEKSVYYHYYNEKSASSTFSTTYKYEKSLCSELKAIISKYNRFDYYKKEYAKGVLKCIKRVVSVNENISTNDEFTIELKEILRVCSLTIEEKLLSCALSNRIIFKMLYQLYSIKSKVKNILS